MTIKNILMAATATLCCACTNGDATFYEVVIGAFESESDCTQGAQLSTESSSNTSYTEPITWEFFPGQDNKQYLHSATAWGGNVGSTIESTEAGMPGALAKKYDGQYQSTDTNDPVVGGASRSETERITVTVEMALDGSTIVGTLTINGSESCTNSGTGNCPVNWRNSSCTRVAKYKGHRTSNVNKQHYI